MNGRSFLIGFIYVQIVNYLSKTLKKPPVRMRGIFVEQPGPGNILPELTVSGDKVLCFNLGLSIGLECFEYWTWKLRGVHRWIGLCLQLRYLRVLSCGQLQGYKWLTKAMPIVYSMAVS